MLLRFISTSLLVLVVSTANAPAATHNVGLSGLNFVPKDITVAEGDTVVWTHSGAMSHTVTEDLGAFNQPLNSANPTVTVVFSTAFLAANPRVNNRYDYHCIPHQSFGMVGSVTVTVASAWTDIGFGLAGSSGVPQLAGTGTLQPSTSGSLDLTNGAGGAFAILFVTVGPNTPTPFYGGVLATVPVSLQLPLTLPASGNLPLPFVMPAGVPPGLKLTCQWGIQDAGAVQGVALSNAVQATTP
ncbi:MAG: hypothetical protein HY812_13075 [Planctomycetes bacterium]|nr:hypothetical protein [Planctomycetota bacterium]